MEQKNSSVVIAVNTKSTGLALLLTFLFGSIGMLYVTIPGAIIMFILELIIVIPTMGLGIIITHPICMIWAVIAVKNYNKKIISGIYSDI